MLFCKQFEDLNSTRDLTVNRADKRAFSFDHQGSAWQIVAQTEVAYACRIVTLCSTVQVGSLLRCVPVFLFDWISTVQFCSLLRCVPVFLFDWISTVQVGSLLRCVPVFLFDWISTVQVGSLLRYEGCSKSFATWHDNVKMSMHGIYQ